MSYLISYFSVGLLLACAAALHGTFSHNKAKAFIFTIFFWPILILATPESFFHSRHIGHNNSSVLPDRFNGLLDPEASQSGFKDKLSKLLLTEESSLTEEERHRLANTAKYGETRISLFGDTADFEDILEKYWNHDVPPEIYHSFNSAHSKLNENVDERNDIRFSIKRPDWYIGLSNEFVKCISKIDGKKRGKILEAISKISAAPTTLHGDTVKPLSNNLAGLWRFRIGDDRLVYYPDTESKQVILISFSSRTEVYENIPDISNVI
jgi:mRNA-degrading endonuclease RelE of RelBE toxin-antitoxin system